jgi:hypothetical protein
MENTASTPSGEPLATPRSSPGTAQRDRNIALICAVLLLIGMPVGWLPGSTGDVIGLIALSLFNLGLMAWIIVWLLPRERAAGPARARRTVVILTVLAVLSCVVFWTGLPFPLGAGAIALGLSLRESSTPTTGRGAPTAGVALGTLAVVASFVVLLVG